MHRAIIPNTAWPLFVRRLNFVCSADPCTDNSNESRANALESIISPTQKPPIHIVLRTIVPSLTNLEARPIQQLSFYFLSRRRDTWNAMAGMTDKERAAYRDKTRDPRLRRKSPSPGSLGRAKDGFQHDRYGLSGQDTGKQGINNDVDTSETPSRLKEIQEKGSRQISLSSRVTSPIPLHQMALTTTIATTTDSTTSSPSDNSRMLTIAEDLDDPIICNMPIDGTGQICRCPLPGVIVVLRRTDK